MRIEMLFPRVPDRFSKPKAVPMKLEGAIDVSAISACGVYVLALNGKVVFVGWSRRMLSLVAGHDNLAHREPKPWNPIAGVVFDQILVIPCGPDRAKVLAAELIAEHKPKHNSRPTVIPIRRKLA